MTPELEKPLCAQQGADIAKTVAPNATASRRFSVNKNRHSFE